MQKVVYLLKVIGGPLEVEYGLHHYGPYSQDVSQLADEMVRAKLLVEEVEANGFGRRFSYGLDDEVRQSLSEFEASPEGRSVLESMAPFESRARDLLRADLRDLEYAATIVFFHLQDRDWPEAVEKMRQFKRPQDDQALKRAETLAREVVPV